MAAYHQMGNDSWNLLDEASLAGYAGVVLSPVNASPEETKAKLPKAKSSRPNLEVILDPQFYRPKSKKGQLGAWPHITADLDSADPANREWWKARCASLAKVAAEVGATSVCSPSFVPTKFDEEFYAFVIETAATLSAETSLKVLLTAIVRLQDLAKPEVVMRLASALSTSPIKRFYLVFHDELEPRKQRSDYQTLANAFRLIEALEKSGIKTLVSFSGLDMLLWKAAGATDIATGKHFNLRRFAPSRWDDETEGGRQLPYWTEGSMLTWFREDDLRLLDEEGLIDRAAAADNPYAQEILKIIDERSGKPWLGTAWRQYLHWFQKYEREADKNFTFVSNTCYNADAQWQKFRETKALMFEPDNDGSWVRAWINALRTATRPPR